MEQIELQIKLALKTVTERHWNLTSPEDGVYRAVSGDYVVIVEEDDDSSGWSLIIRDVVEGRDSITEPVVEEDIEVQLKLLLERFRYWG